MAMVTNGYHDHHEPRNSLTSNGPHAEGVLGIIACKSLKTVGGPWRLERQTSTVSK